MAIIRQDTFDQGSLVERLELERLNPSLVEFRRYDSGLQLIEQREATTDEERSVDDADGSEILSIKAANVSQAVTTLRQWATDAEGTTVTTGNAVATLQTVVDRLGVFFDRFADLIESKGLDT